MSAEVYTWRDFTGVVRMSNDPPRWYQADARVIGPRVIVTQGSALIDDTGLPLRQRLALQSQE